MRVKAGQGADVPQGVLQLRRRSVPGIRRAQEQGVATFPGNLHRVQQRGGIDVAGGGSVGMPSESSPGKECQRLAVIILDVADRGHFGILAEIELLAGFDLGLAEVVADAGLVLG